jgi:RNA-directed DNA polymerase
MNEAKAVLYSKKEVWEAYKRVKANKGAAGVDERSIEDFESPSRSRVRRRIGSGA